MTGKSDFGAPGMADGPVSAMRNPTPFPAVREGQHQENHHG